MKPPIDYRKNTEEMRAAWFAYKDEYLCVRQTLSVVDFAAGWNAAMATAANKSEDTNDQTRV